MIGLPWGIAVAFHAAELARQLGSPLIRVLQEQGQHPRPKIGAGCNIARFKGLLGHRGGQFHMETPGPRGGDYTRDKRRPLLPGQSHRTGRHAKDPTRAHWQVQLPTRSDVHGYGKNPAVA
jgi:hypothetical protein